MKIIKTRYGAAVVLILFLGVGIAIYAHSLGITGTTRKNGFGCNCHSPNPSPGVTVAINGPDTLMINQTAEYSVTIKGGPLVRAGTDIAVSSGTLSPVSSDLRRDNSNGELTHTSPKAPSGNEVTFNFNYQAPASAGSVTLYANGNSVNFNGAPDAGDMWNYAPNKIVAVVAVTGIENNAVAKDFNLNQNYPNPFNPSTIISYQIPVSGRVLLKVYDALGNEVATLVNQVQSAGNHQVEFNTQQTTNNRQLSSGIYFYRLTAGSFSSVKKMILTK